MSEIQADVAVVGASLAGCAAARLFAQRGLSVALLERQADRTAYKRLCGHFIQPSATGVLRRLGLAELIERAGGVRTRIDLWTPWGEIPHQVDGEHSSYGYAVRRVKLDPMLRELAIATPGVSYFGGCRVTALLSEGGVIGRMAEDELHVRARLVVGADGRNSTVAELARARTTTSANARFCYMAYYRDVDLGRGPDVTARFWALDRDAVIASRNDDNITILALFLAKDRLSEFKKDRDAAFINAFRTLPDPPHINGARLSKLIGYIDYPVLGRNVIPSPTVALIGDAAHSADPVMAIGCGWALQSAEWLVEATAPALREGSSLASALKRYRRIRSAHIGGHERFLALAARSTKPNPIQKLMFSAAVRDRQTAHLLRAFAGREIPVRRFLSPSAISRAMLVNIRSAARQDHRPAVSLTAEGGRSTD